jgi:hypothetical protein
VPVGLDHRPTLAQVLARVAHGCQPGIREPGRNETV